MHRLLQASFIFILLGIIHILPGSIVFAETKVVYPGPEYWADERHRDIIEILRTALAKTERDYGPYSLIEASAVMNTGRADNSLIQQKYINIAWGSTSIEKERKLLPIRIPLRKGILGYRLMLTTLSGQKKTAEIQDIEGLKKVVLAQGLGWGDVEVLSRAGLNVVTANYENIFKMLNKHRVDLFPRGVNEVFDELELNWEDYPNIIIGQNLLLKYAWPYYFFFNKRDTELAARIETGLWRMIEDGSFDAIFEKYNRADIEQGDLRSRKMIELDNPILPEETPLEDERLWFNP
ncbi:substrate-binding periplasmic protein [Maridesulfovibrio sp.]|uniref:substrate-binding periplasmic protein n=1 Tax=unclassified Maridesulfovibrio TaxID=2794999 RepID=UPI003B010038